MNKGNGKQVCGTCLGELEYRFTRARKRKYTSEEGPAVEITSVTVGRCPEDGHYRTTYPDDIVRNKHYCLNEIQSVLDGRNDYTLASPRTMCYWRSWFRGLLEIVVTRLWRAVRCIIPKATIALMLKTFLTELSDHWLRYVLDLFYTTNNNLCMFFDLLDVTMNPKCEKLQRTHRNGGAETAERGCMPPPGG